MALDIVALKTKLKRGEAFSSDTFLEVVIELLKTQSRLKELEDVVAELVKESKEPSTR